MRSGSPSAPVYLWSIPGGGGVCLNREEEETVVVVVQSKVGDLARFRWEALMGTSGAHQAHQFRYTVVTQRVRKLGNFHQARRTRAKGTRRTIYRYLARLALKEA